MPEAGPAAPGAARWYHTIELPDGSVTPGSTTCARPVRGSRFRRTLAGKRCLDVGTRDGFWAFEMERRGADEVIAIDLDDEREMDWPQPRPPRVEEEAPELERRASAFGIAHELLDSKVERRDQSVYELTTDKVGEFDFAVIGTLLLHLRDPIGALTAIGRVLRGPLLVNDVISLGLTLRSPRTPSAELHADQGLPFWWTPNLAGLKRQVEAAASRSRPRAVRIS